MKLEATLLTCVLILFGMANSQTSVATQSVPWQTYTVKGEEFSVDMPTLPAMHLSYELVRPPDKYRQVIMMGSYADGVVYTAYVLENVESRLSLDAFINREAPPGRTWNPAGERDLNRGGRSIKAVIYTDPQWGMAQYFATHDRLYKFTALGAPPNDPRLIRFFSSISFSKPTNAVEVVDGPGLPYEPPVQSAPDDNTNKAFTGKEVDRKIRLAMKPEPSYTEAARQNLVTGTVILKCVFASNGSVQNIRLVSGLPFGLTEKAIDTAKKIKFIPAMKDGKYVSMWMQLEYNFYLY